MQTLKTLQETLAFVLDAFAVEGGLVGVEQWTGGHINQTFVVSVQQPEGVRRYVIQRVNSRVFPNIDGLMENAIRVSEHAGRKLAHMPSMSVDAVERGTLRFLRTRLGQPGVPDPSGDVWRLYPCIERAKARLVATEPGEAFEAARAFGLFQGLLSDLPGGRLQETIPGFHDTPRRFAQLDAAVRADPRGRAKTVLPELQAIDARRAGAAVLQRAFGEGVFPERVVHNDAKLSNVLLDTETGKAVCVIDLDTVMPGYALHDFGDLVRSICNPSAEDEADLSKIVVRIPYFEALVSGYLQTAGNVLTSGEVALLPDAGWVLTLEVAVRFLADYLNGDVYFRIKYPEQNLARARAQLTLARRIEEAMPTLRSMVRRA